jgi:hypothetical protein
MNYLQRWIIILGLFYKTESLNCKIIGLERSQMEFLFVVLLLLL